MSIKRSFLLVTSMFFIGCGGGGGSSPDPGDLYPDPEPPPHTGKPLPDTCESTLELNLLFPQKSDVFNYVVEVGYRSGVYFKRFNVSHRATGFSFKKHYDEDGNLLLNDELLRGNEYHFSVTRKLRDGTSTSRTLHSFMPTCDDREAYKVENPFYEEPIMEPVHFSWDDWRERRQQSPDDDEEYNEDYDEDDY